jgi:hypothetical protein
VFRSVLLVPPIADRSERLVAMTAWSGASLGTPEREVLVKEFKMTIGDRNDHRSNVIDVTGTLRKQSSCPAPRVAGAPP